MTKHSTFLASTTLLLAVVLLPLGAAAQSVEVRRPYRGLFGGDPNDKTASSFSVELMGAYDDNVYGGSGTNPAPTAAQQSSTRQLPCTGIRSSSLWFCATQTRRTCGAIAIGMPGISICTVTSHNWSAPCATQCAETASSAAAALASAVR